MLRLLLLRELKPGTTHKFQFKRGGRLREGFIARVGRKVVAYENVCQHIALPLDYDDGQFFTQDGAHFICQTHGALYEPRTGLCVRGPCEGESLNPLKVVVQDGVIWLK